MRIVQVTPSSGDSFYCENCLRDAALVKAMRDLGHDVLMIPMYLPLPDASNELAKDVPVFFGGVNVYLQQKSAIFGKTPRWLDSLFDRPSILKWISRRVTMTSAKDMSETTISMLQAEHGRQKKELQRLLDWLDAQDNKPDIVCLSNVLLAGLARRIKADLGVPVVCLLQDEDGFLDGLGPQYMEEAWQTLAQRCRDVDGFIAVSHYYEDVMRQRLGLPADKTHVVYTGILPDGYVPSQRSPETPTIGYLSRMCFDRGLDTLVEAFCLLKKDHKLRNLKLRIAGGKTGNDKAFIRLIRRQLASSILTDDAEFLTDFDHNARVAFLQSLSVLSVPEKQPVAYGLYVLEALAVGVPVVQPASGVFPELLEITGGGVLYEPNNVQALAAAMQALLLDPSRACELGRQGRKKVLERFNITQSAEQIVRIYQNVVRQFSRQ